MYLYMGFLSYEEIEDGSEIIENKMDVYNWNVLR